MSEFGRDEKYWSERLNNAKDDVESLLCLTKLENFELKAKISEQAAQVEKLRNAIFRVRATYLASSGCEPSISLFQFTLDEANEIALDAKPSQCLAEHEREVAARAVEKAADYAAGLISDKYGIATSGTMLEILDHKTDVVLCVAEYANKIRQQASK